MFYFSYNDYMDYTENGEMNEIKKLEEEIVKYEVKNGKNKKDNKKCIIKMLKDKNCLKSFMEEFFNLNEIEEIENIVYCNNITENKEDNIICKIENKEMFILIKVIKEIDTNITYKMFEESINIIKKWNEEEKKENKRYPIVIPIVIYLGKEQWNINFYDIYSNISYTEYKNNIINFAYNFIDINKLEIRKLHNMKSQIVKEFINTKINIYK